MVSMVLGKFLRDVAKLNQDNFRVFGPDENLSNLLGAVFEVTGRQWDAWEANGGGVDRDRPYWTRAHRDWRVWTGVVLMLAAMVVYLMTNDLAWGLHVQSQRPLLGATGKQP